ncbi:hypothetical protein RUM43_003535 [Polyplax serrata]|uniref:Sas10 C-terminal domain-containing protein n=1 Tax=Polyplax serrata TaxID=468196 RepID=A0AAN8PFP3_POLSC
MESDAYEVTDSEDEYSKDDKLHLEYARKSMKKKEASSDEEVYGFEQSDSDEYYDENEELDEYEEDDDEEKGNNSDIDMGSDLEDEEKLPDDRAWGKKKKSFYNTDFVDQDYDGIYQDEEAEIAELEEEEAKNIQKRLAQQLAEADFTITEAVTLAETVESTEKNELIKSDLTKLTKRQKLDLVKKESPEFFVLIQDFKEKMEEANKILPIINYFKAQVKESFSALDYLQTRLTIILNYCTNVSFYLYLKARRIPVKNHPILKSLFRYRQLLQQMDEVDQNVMKPQVDNIADLIKSGKEIQLDDTVVTKKAPLKLLTEKQHLRDLLKVKKELMKKQKEEEAEENEGEEEGALRLSEMDLIEDDEDEEEEQEKTVPKDQTEKRAITYEMAKNKGLTPKRKKELRNPRVKNRRKYEKAKIRRKGQVRTPRVEIPVYGGEASGIKTQLTKSIKFK